MLAKVNKTPTRSDINRVKREYKKADKAYVDARYKLSYKVDHHDWEILSVNDFLKVKELYIQSKKLYWKLYLLENPDDNATVEAYAFLKSLGSEKSLDFLASHGLTTHRLIDAIRENPNYLKEVTV